MNPHVLQSALGPLRGALEDVEAERDRLNRRIRRLREAIRSVVSTPTGARSASRRYPSPAK